jgi:hypothetical protein
MASFQDEMKYLRITITDTLGFWDDYLETYVFNAEQGKSYTGWYRLPDEWITNGELKPDRREAVYRYWYGETWRQGNGDGSQYVVLAIDEHELNADEVAHRVWEQRGKTCLAIDRDGRISRIDAKQL